MKLHTISAYAEKIGVNRNTLTRWVKSGNLPPNTSAWRDDNGRVWIIQEKENENVQR